MRKLNNRNGGSEGGSGTLDEANITPYPQLIQEQGGFGKYQVM